MSRWTRAKHLLRSSASAFVAVVWAYAWIIPVAVALRMPPGVAAATVVATVAVFLARNVVRPLRSRPRLAARLRLRPFGRYVPLLTLAIGAKLVLMLSGFVLHEEIAARRVLPRMPEDSELVPHAFIAHPFGAVALLLTIVVLAPLIEEFAFRGKMQHELERSFGIVPAIVVPAVVFSALHGVIDAIHHLPFGLFAGWVVWRTGSIWGAVYMHALNNAVAGGALYLPDRWATRDEVPAGLWPFAIVAGLAAIGALIAIGARIHTIATRARPRASGWPIKPSHAGDAATARG